jgi:hypothetical protein
VFYRTRCRVSPCVPDTSTSFLDFSIEVKKRGEERTGRNVFDYPTTTKERGGKETRGGEWRQGGVETRRRADK